MVDVGDEALDFVERVADDDGAGCRRRGRTAADPDEQRGHCNEKDWCDREQRRSGEAVRVVEVADGSEREQGDDDAFLREHHDAEDATRAWFVQGEAGHGDDADRGTDFEQSFSDARRVGRELGEHRERPDECLAGRAVGDPDRERGEQADPRNTPESVPPPAKHRLSLSGGRGERLSTPTSPGECTPVASSCGLKRPSGDSGT